MHRSQHTGTHQEGSQKTEGESSYRQQYGPALERAALFRDGQRMDQRRAHQPGHEGSIFNRIPEPPAAPAEFIVSPPAAQHDSGGQERPGYRGPGTRPARPGRIQFPAQQCGNGERERDREPHIAHVQHRRMDHQTRILQQWIQLLPISGGRQQTIEWIRGEQHEQYKTYRDPSHHAQYARNHFFRQVFAERGDCGGPGRQYGYPQQQRTFVAAPYRGEAVLHGQPGIGVFRDIQHGKIIVQKSIGKGCKRKGDKYELSKHQRARKAH